MGRLCRQPAWGLLGWLLFHSRSTGVVSRRRQDSPRSPQDTPYPGPDSPPRSHWPLVRPPPRAPRTRVFTVGPPIPAPRRVTNFVPSSAGAIGAKLVRPRPLPTCRSGRRAAPRRALRPGPRGAAHRPPGTHRGVAAVAAQPPPPREGEGGVCSPRRGRRGDLAVLPAGAPGHCCSPARLLRGRSARTLRRGAGDN